ncbi:MAG: hypothetical protein U9N45_07520, partial [Gemmatimonadota bacterium]|nr:hypothetical protein [Gemmatimonadota bacterium]
MLDVSGFTSLLTFLTDRFGKQEAGDIMNMSILNRFCLNRIGFLVDHFGCEDEDGCPPGEKALKVALSFRSQLARVTEEVRGELREKLSGKAHQESIVSFIRKLQIKASGSVVSVPGGQSEFYGTDHRVRITWGETARRVAAAEKVGGSDDRVDPRVAEFKGIGLDRRALGALDGLLVKGWLRKSDFRLRNMGRFHKLVLTRTGHSRLLERAEDIVAGYSDKLGDDIETPVTGALREDAVSRIRKAAVRAEQLLPFLFGMDFIELVVRHLDPEGNRRHLFADHSSRIHETGILFTNFTVSGSDLLDELAEAVTEVTSRYGLVCKYNIFPMGDFNLMALLGLGDSGTQASDRLYAEVLWQCWRDILSVTGRNFGPQHVSMRSGLSVGTCLQGPVGDNLIHNELTVIGPDCNMAARLLARAMAGKDSPNGTLVAARDCYRPLSHLVQPVKPFEKAHLKGFSDPVPLFAINPRIANEDLDTFTSRLRQLPLVSDKGEILDTERRLHHDRCLGPAVSFLESVEKSPGAAGRGVISFVGPGGLGKTRRMAELMHWCLKRGWTVLMGECLSWYQGSSNGQGSGGDGDSEIQAVPFHPFIRILSEQVFDILPEEKAGEALAKIRKTLARFSGETESAD